MQRLVAYSAKNIPSLPTPTEKQTWHSRAMIAPEASVTE
jgi:hypothetical protein